MDKAIRDEWILALRSGAYKQATGRLKDGDRYCCLGVLCAIHPDVIEKDNGVFVYKGHGATNNLPYELGWDLDIPIMVAGYTLQTMNDDKGKTFSEIADWIEANL